MCILLFILQQQLCWHKITNSRQEVKRTHNAMSSNCRATTAGIPLPSAWLWQGAQAESIGTRHARGRVYYTTQAKNPGQDPTRVRIEPALYQKVNTIVNPILLWSLQSKRNIKRKIFIHRGKLKRFCPALPSHPTPSTFRCPVFWLSGTADYQIFTRCQVVGVLLLLSSIKAIMTKSCHSCSSPGRAEGQHQLPSLSALQV